MKILHIIQRFWPARGGAELYLLKVSSHLAAQGHDVTVATTDALDFELFWDPARRRVAEPSSEELGIRILRFPVRHLPIPGLAYPAIRRMLWLLSAARPVPVGLLHWLARYTPWAPGLWQWLEETDEQFDLVGGMTICFEPLLEAGLRYARRHEVPYVIYPLTHLGAGPAPATDALSRFYTMRHQVDLVRGSSGVVAQTEDEKAFYVAQGVPERRIEAIGAGVDPEEVIGGEGGRFRDEHGIHRPIVLSLSSMSYDKGTVHTVEAVRRLWQAGREVELVLAGALLSPFRDYLNSLPANERERIRVLGSVTEQQKKDLLAAADMLVMPSRTDSFGIVYLEAWLYQKPVIGARTWGIRNVISEGEDGLLVPFGDVEALSGAITRLLDNPELATEMGRRGERKVYDSLTWSHKVEQVERLYSVAVSGQQSAISY